MKHLDKSSTKKGAASLYIVILTTILFGVITLSFIRIILSESMQSSNDDLSRSAYDSALAGVEDAKIAVNKYYQCKSDSSDPTCANYLNNLFGGDCESFNLKKILYPSSTDSEVKIQESNSNGNNTDQAYTCVIVNNVVSDYRSTLTSDTRTRVIPLGVNSDKLSEVRRVEFRWYSEINGTDFKNLGPPSGSGSDWIPSLESKGRNPTPPVISLTLLRTGGAIDINSFNNAISDNYSTMILHPVSSTGTNNISASQIEAAGNATVPNNLFKINCEHGEFACTVNLDTYRVSEKSETFCNQDWVNEYQQIYGRIPDGCDSENTVSGSSVDEVKNAIQAKLNQRSDVVPNSMQFDGALKNSCELWGVSSDPFGNVPCSTQTDKYCYEMEWDAALSRYKCARQSSFTAKYRVTYQEKGLAFFEDGGNAFLIVSLPYGETVTDFVVTLYDKNDKPIEFKNVQISVDSTGRANQLLRRVETRLDPSDSFFPYPDYEVTLGGDGDDSFSKNFWITHNCWTEKGSCDNNGSL